MAGLAEHQELCKGYFNFSNSPWCEWLSLANIGTRMVEEKRAQQRCEYEYNYYSSCIIRYMQWKSLAMSLEKC